MAEGREARLQSLEAQETQRRLSREQFLTPNIREEDVEIATLGGTVHMRGMTHGRRKALREEAKYGTPQYDDDLFTRLVIVETITDPQLNMPDVERILEQDSVVFDEIVLKLNIFALAGASESLKKGSSPTQNGDTPSDSAKD